MGDAGCTKGKEMFLHDMTTVYLRGPGPGLLGKGILFVNC